MQNKYIVRLSFAGLFLNIIINMVLYRYFMIEEMILKQVATANTNITDLYTKHIWSTNSIAVNKINKNYYLNLLQDQDFINFASASAGWFININKDVSLYDLQGNKFITSGSYKIFNYNDYSDDTLLDKIITKVDRYFLQSLISDQAFNNAFKGITSHVLLPKVIIQKGDQKNKAVFVISYIPIISNFTVNGILEISTDITQQWQNIIILEKKVLITFLVVFLIFYIIVVNNTKYAQRVIDTQFETNRKLTAEITKVQNESSAHSQFFANVSHELRTPLNAIIGFSEIMLSDPNKQNQDYIKDINSAGKHLLSIINDILDLSKASADKLKVDNIALDLNKLILSTIRFVKPRADEAKVELIEKLPQEHIIIKADPKRLKQVLLNLLSNAVKFTNAHGSVMVRIEKNELKGEVYIKVIDTGIGIDEKDIPKTLTAFGQIDSALSRKYEGTGLGLPLSQRLVKLMRGKFDLQSKLGVGTTITLTFTYDSSIEI